MSDRVVITGIGVRSPNGGSRKEYWESLQAGKSGIGEISLFPTEHLSCRIAGEVKDLTYDCLPAKERKRVPRLVPMAILASEEALSDALLQYSKLSETDRQEIGVFIGSGAGGLDFGEREYQKFFADQGHVSPFAIVSSFVGMVSSEVSIHFGFRGPSHVFSTGCTSSSDAIGYAAAMIRSGMVRYAVTGGAEACITPAIITAFVQMGTTVTQWNHDPQRASRRVLAADPSQGGALDRAVGRPRVMDARLDLLRRRGRA